VVFAHVDANPLPKKEAVPFVSPFSRYFKWHFTGGMVAAFSVAFVVLAGVTSGAAENALPGDALYPIKVNVNEQIVKGLSFGNEAKARAYATLAERRLVEIEQLTIEEKTENRPRDEKVMEELNEDFKEHAEEVHNYVAKIEESGNIGDAIEVATSFETTILAHTEILEEVTGEVPLDPTLATLRVATTSDPVDPAAMTMTAIVPDATTTLPIATTTATSTDTADMATATSSLSVTMMELKMQGDRADATGVKLEGVASTTATTTLDTAFEKIKVVAERRINELEEKIDEIKAADLAEEFADEIQTFEEAKSDLNEAIELRDENIKEALQLNKEASKAAHEAIVLIKTQQTLDINLENK
jgi:hypothetical protein